MKRTNVSIDTQVIHAGEPNPRIGGAVSVPVFQSSTFESSSASDYHSIPYLRLNNSPNHIALHEKLASLENTESGLVTSSGMAAISTALLSVLKSGDHLIAQTGLYGGTHTFLVHDLTQLGIEVDLVDMSDISNLENSFKPNTRAIYVESMTNPKLNVIALDEVVARARSREIVTLIDNTLPSPVNFRPAEMGFDLVCHSCTKYLNGHSDIVAGAILGRAELISDAKRKLDHFGATLDPHACFLLHRGLKTLPLRVRQQNSNALALAEMLSTHNKVLAVHYAGLEHHPDHVRASKWFSGYGGLLSFDHAGGAEGAHEFVKRLKLAVEAVSLGGVETLVTLPAESSHSGMSPAERVRAGIDAGLIRVAVGVEGIEDLVSDFKQALSGG
ncbi:MAG: aminotransferase class I/II-fold pyridoxal phosphate-dependent enzyme [Pseudomonadota bacterium]